MARVLDALPPTHTADGSTATGPAPAAAAIDPTEGAGPTGGGGGGAGGAPSDMLLSGFFSVMFAIALDGSQGADFRIGNTDALSALVALACRARRGAVRVGAVRCMYELLLRNPLNVVCFVAAGEAESDVGGFEATPVPAAAPAATAAGIAAATTTATATAACAGTRTRRRRVKARRSVWCQAFLLGAGGVPLATGSRCTVGGCDGAEGGGGRAVLFHCRSIWQFDFLKARWCVGPFRKQQANGHGLQRERCKADDGRQKDEGPLATQQQARAATTATTSTASSSAASGGGF